MRCPSCGNENREGARFCDSCGSELTAEPAAAEPRQEPLPADVPIEIAGRYRVKRFLGQGGRKRVYLSDDTATGTEVAVALFDTEGVGAAIQARTRREAEAMRKLGDHPQVVTVLDTGEEDGNPFIVSRYMPGGDVEGLLAAAGGRLEVQRAVEIAADVTRALEHTHARGVVHRDLKPANVWIDDDGHARLGDFGLATTEARSRVSGGTLVGTVAYLPPEQALGEASGPQSDLYSLGALLYEMLSGQPPFPGDDAVSIISQHLHADPVPPSRHNPEVPEALDRVVLALLAKRPEERPANAAEARERMLAALEEKPAEVADQPRANPLESLAGGVFVGRERELERLREAVDGALAGRGSLQLLVGEPGIGKTRAAEELATYARVSGARVYWGRCREDEGAPAYWPWVQAIRSYARDADPVALAWQLGAGAAEVAQLIPEVAEKLDVEPAKGSDSEEARFRLFDSVTTLMLGAARDRPIVLVLDDLHWADEPSLLLLRFAARELASSGLLILGTYRDVELGRHHPLARMLGEISGIEGSRRIPLKGLSVGAVERYLEMTAGAPAPVGLAEAVQERTDGNPFFVGEVVRLLASEGKLTSGGSAAELQIPQGVREVIGRRLDRLSDETNATLRVAAVIGRDFDEELVWRVADMQPEQLMTAATEAIAERLVTDLSDGHYSFAHALVRDTLYEELSPPKRSAAPRAHRRRDRGDLRRERRRAARGARPSLPGGGPPRRPRQGDRLRPARRGAGHGAARLRRRRRRLWARARGARADGRTGRGAALQPLALARRGRSQVRPRRGCARRVRAGGGFRPSPRRRGQPRRGSHRDRDDERRRPPRREAARPARRVPRVDWAGAHRPPRRAAQREVGGDVLGRQRPHRVDEAGRRGDRDRA